MFGRIFGKRSEVVNRDTQKAELLAAAIVNERACSPVDVLDLDKFRDFVIGNLSPNILLNRLREQRSLRPDYGYCNIVFYRCSNKKAEEIGLDKFIREANDDDGISAALAGVKAYGFEVTVGTYDEPSGRDLQIGVKQDAEAEHIMRTTESLD